MNILMICCSPLHDIVTHKTTGTNITNFLIIKKYYHYLNSFLILAAISANSSWLTANFFPPKYISDSFVIGIKWICAWGTSKPMTANPTRLHSIAVSWAPELPV